MSDTKYLKNTQPIRQEIPGYVTNYMWCIL